MLGRAADVSPDSRIKVQIQEQPHTNIARLSCTTHDQILWDLRLFMPIVSSACIYRIVPRSAYSDSAGLAAPTLNLKDQECKLEDDVSVALLL